MLVSFVIFMTLKQVYLDCKIVNISYEVHVTVSLSLGQAWAGSALGYPSEILASFAFLTISILLAAFKKAMLISDEVNVSLF